VRTKYPTEFPAWGSAAVNQTPEGRQVSIPA